MCTVLAIVMVKSPLDGVKYATSLCSECGVTVTRPANTRYFSPALAVVANVLRMMLLSGTDSLTGDRARVVCTLLTCMYDICVGINAAFSVQARSLSMLELGIGPEFSATVDGDGPVHSNGELTFISWNVYGIADSKSGAINSKRRELEEFLSPSSRQPDPARLVFVQETWLQDDDTLDIPGYVWHGRNRTKIVPGCQRGSGGIGVLVHDSIAPFARVVSTPSYGGTEGVMWLRVDHGRRRQHDMYCMLYLEQQRPQFPVDNDAVFDGIQSDWLRYSESAYNMFLVGDFNTRVGQLQEAPRGLGTRAGEAIAPSRQARELVARFRAMNAVILHGRLCRSVHTFSPSDGRSPSICDYVVGQSDRLDRVARCSVVETTLMASDHRPLSVTLNYTYGDTSAPATSGSRVRYRVSRLRDAETKRKFLLEVERELSPWMRQYHAAQPVMTAHSVEAAWNDWRCAFDRAATATLGKRKIQNSSRQSRIAEPWWTDELSSLLQRRRACSSRLRRTPNSLDEPARFVAAKGAYFDAKRALKQACKKARRAYQDSKLAAPKTMSNF